MGITHPVLELVNQFRFYMKGRVGGSHPAFFDLPLDIYIRIYPPLSHAR